MSGDIPAVAQLAAADPKAARQLLAAQQAQAADAAKIAAADAAAERQLRLLQRRQELAAEQRRGREHAEEQARHRKQLHRALRAERARQQALRRPAHAVALLAWLRSHADDGYAALTYALAVGGAVFGQITAATARGWPLAAGVVIAVAVEGLALVMALTAQKLGLAGEAARAPRILTWVCAGAAAIINYLGHAHASRVGPALLAALSLAGIIVWEIRSGAAHCLQLRALGLLPEPPAAFGVRRWLRYPPSTFAAWSIDVRDRVSGRAAVLLETAAAETRHRTAAARLRTARTGGGPRLRPRTSRPASTSVTGPAGIPAGPARVQVHASGPRAASYADQTGPAVPASSPRRPVAAAGPDRVRAAAGFARPAPTDPAAARATGSLAARSPARPQNPASAAEAQPSARPRQPLNIADLLPAGRQVRDQLTAQGVALSRSVLIKGLRERQIAISTDQATALLAALRSDPGGTPAARTGRPG